MSVATSQNRQMDRAKTTREKGGGGGKQSATPNKTNSDPSKQDSVNKVQATPEQLRMARLISIAKDIEDPELQIKIKQVMELTGKSNDAAVVALHDCDNDAMRAINMLLEGDSGQGEWETTGKKKKPKAPADKTADANGASTNGVSPKDRIKPLIQSKENYNNRDGTNRRDGGERAGRGDGSRDRGRSMRNPPPPRLSQNRNWSGRERENNERNLENSRERNSDGFGRGRYGGGMSNGPGGRGGGMAGRGRGGPLGPRGRMFRNRGSNMDSDEQPGGLSPNDNFAPSIDTWDSGAPSDKETSSRGGERGGARRGGSSGMMYNMTNWNEEEKPSDKGSFPATDEWDNDEWNESVVETKVFTPSVIQPPSSANHAQQGSTNASSLFNDSRTGGGGGGGGVQNDLIPQVGQSIDLAALLQQKPLGHTSSAQAPGSSLTSGLPPVGSGGQLTASQQQFLSQYTQQATEQLKSVIGVGGSLSSNSTAVSAGGGGGNYNSLYSSTNFSVAVTTTSYSTSYGTPSSYSVSNMVNSAGQNNQLGSNSLSSLDSQPCGGSNAIQGNTVSLTHQSALPSKTKTQRAKMPNKIPSSAVEMPDDSISSMDMQFGGLEFGSEPATFEFGSTNTSYQNPYIQTVLGSSQSGRDMVQSNSMNAVMSGNLLMQQQQQVSGKDLGGVTPTKSVIGPPPGVSGLTTNQQTMAAVEALSSYNQTQTDRKPFNNQRQPSALDSSLSNVPNSLDGSLSSYSSLSAGVQGGGHATSGSTGSSGNAGGLSAVGGGSSYQSGYQKTPSYSSMNEGYSNQGYGGGGMQNQSSVYSNNAYNNQGSYNPATTNCSSQSQSAVYTTTPTGYAASQSLYSYGSSVPAGYGAGDQGNSGYAPSQRPSDTLTGAAHKLSQAIGTASSDPPSLKQTSNQHSYDAHASSSSMGSNLASSSASQLTTTSTVAAPSGGSVGASGSSSSQALGGMSAVSSATALPTLSAAKSSSALTGKTNVPGLPPGVHPGHVVSPPYILGQGGMPYYQPPIYSFEDIQMLQQQQARIPMGGYYDMYHQTSGMTNRDAGNFGYSDNKYSRTGDTSSPSPATGSSSLVQQQQQSVNQQSQGQQSQQQQAQPFMAPPGYGFYYPGVPAGYASTGYGAPMYPGMSVPVSNSHAVANSQYQKQASYGSHQYGNSYDSLGQSQDYSKGYGGVSQNPKGMGGASGAGGLASNNADMSSVYAKSHAAKSMYDKSGYHAGTPPPFQMAGSQSSGPTGAAYAPTQFIPVIQTHSPAMLHHQMHQDSGPGSVGGQRQAAGPNMVQKGGGLSSKPNYSTNYWNN